MVGSVLMQRMLEENDFDNIDEPVFFSTSQVGQQGPDIGRETASLMDATSLIGPPARIRERLAAWKECGNRGSLDLMLIPSLEPEALTLLAEEML